MNNKPKSDKLTDRLKTLNYLNERARKELVYHGSQRDKYKELYEEISSSTSWKLLLPVYKIRRILKSSRPSAKHENKIQALRFKLLSLGFTERAYEELRLIASENNSSLDSKNAAWELALWHADKYTQEDAKAALKYLETATKNESDVTRNQRAAILKSEAYLLLDETTKAKKCLEESLEMYGKDPDTLLALANTQEDIDKKYFYVNKAIENSFIMPLNKKPGKSTYLYDSIGVESSLSAHYHPKEAPLVSVIIPVYNAEETIHTALDSLLQQTWPNMEILVSDDCSTDSTTSIVKNYSKKHSNIRLIKGDKNSGPYVARNLALNEAQGEFITCNDSDDWTHPEKIQKQVEHLISNPGIVGNMSQQARLSNNFVFHRRGNPGYFIQANMSSFLFRKSAVTAELGYWDSVRFGADSEFIRRIKIKFGNEAVVTLSDSLFSFQRKSDESLTGDGKFGYHGFFMGARKEYHESQIFFQSNTDDLSYKFPMKQRPFSVPVSMLPERVKGHVPNFDIIFAADFRSQNKDLVDSIDRLASRGLRVGLVHLYRYDTPVNTPADSSYRKLANSGLATFIVYGEKAKCRYLVLPDSNAIAEKQIYQPDVDAEKVLLSADKAKLSGADLQSALENTIATYSKVNLVTSKRRLDLDLGEYKFIEKDMFSYIDEVLLQQAS